MKFTRLLNKQNAFSRIILILILVCGFVSVVKAQSVEDMSLFESATQDYYSKNYKGALKKFLEVADEHPNNGYLLYNIGNTYFKLGEVGEALQYYERARLFVPREPDLKINLDLASKKLSDEVGSSLSDYLRQTFYFWSDWLTVDELDLGYAAFASVFWLSLIVIFLRRSGFLRLRVLVATLLFLYLTGAVVVKNKLETPGEFAIVLKPEVDVRAVYMASEKPIFKLHEGTKVKITGSQSFGEDQKWLRVELPEGQKGWVESDVLGVI